jgi:hypothetical protein
MPHPVPWTCEECGIFFGRHKDWAQHWLAKHAEPPSPEFIEQVEKLIERLRSRSAQGG